MNPSAVEHSTDLHLFQAMPGNSALLLPDAPLFTIVAVTDGYLQTAGRTRAELIGKGLFEAFPLSRDETDALSQNKFVASLETVLNTKNAHRLSKDRYDIPTASGSFDERFWSIVNKPVLQEDGAVKYIIHSVEDVTAQVKTERREAEMKGIEKGYQEFLSAPILMCIVKGDDYTIAMANDRTLAIWGRTAEVIGKPLFQVLPELDGQGFKEMLDAVRSTGKPQYTYETPTVMFRGGKKETLYFDFIFHPYQENKNNAQASGVICVAHDVTEPVRIRQRFKIVVEQTPNPLLILMGEELVLEVANQALLDLWQVGPDALGKPFLDLLPEMKDQVFVSLLKKVLHTGEPFYGLEVPAVFRRSSGEEEKRFLNFSYKAYREADGSISGVLVTANDVTGQVKANQKLKESEQAMRNIIQHAPVSMLILHGENMVLHTVNERGLAMLGKSPDIIGKPILEVVPEVKEQSIAQILQDVYRTGKPFFGDEWLVPLMQNGQLQQRFFNFSFSPIWANDQIVGVMSVAIEVTEQVKARKQVEKSIQEVQAIVESAPFPIGVYTGREMRIKLVNQSIIEVWGKGPDVVGKTYAEVLPELKETGIYEQLDAVYTTGVPYHARNQRVDLVVDGTLQPFYFNYSFTPLYDAEGTIYGVMNTAAEITDLVVAKQQVEQSEQNFRSMILQAPVAMCIMLGENHVVDIANEAMIQLWGKPADSVINKPIFEALPDARDQGLEKVMMDVYQTGVPFFANEHPVELLRNGKWETVYQNFVYQPYKDANGKILGVLAISVDVTNQVLARQKTEEIVVQRTSELARANQALVESNEELKRLNANLEDFAYAASHDLKEPIRKIHFFSDRLRNQLANQLSKEQNQFFDRLENASKRMGSLVEDLLAYSQATRGLGEAEDVDLNKHVQLVLEDLELEIQQKQAKVQVTHLPTIKGDKRQMQQLFQNLISNALKYSKPGVAPHIRMTTEEVKGSQLTQVLAAQSDDEAYHLITISDNGIGFQQEDAKRIFNVFTRLHSNVEYRGTGVGLSIAQKVVQNHGGVIWAESHPGEGASFKILLRRER